MIIIFLRKNIGTIIAALGFILLCILTFGDLGELMSDQYWQNVRENLTSIGFMSLSLTMVQTVIRQGLAEQALQRGLNTANAMTKYEEHRELIRKATDRLIYLPYFLQIYNKRHTQFRKREFLVNNNYSTEQSLKLSGDKKLIAEYDKIRVNLTVERIKWATTDVVHNKNGQIQTLQEHRHRRTGSAFITSLVLMVAMSFLTRGLFFSVTPEPIWQKFVKLFTYILAIALGSVLGIIKEYEKGAFGIPNDLEELNEIWNEFLSWTIPQWVIDEVMAFEETEIQQKEVEDNERENTGSDVRTDLQEEQEKSEVIQDTCDNLVLPVPSSDDSIRDIDAEKFDR